ncbi:hypothetical protein VPNG_04280 [Cytospora leucostoma]|uniref:SWR1-complex protein 3 domain-containing protein n=1 Tax=Cytospora leucostoma TaxID=1230097 RepID=A0A423XDR1_9PEZI|nr:hypothetical protein VPNG_04280 [Cytospora leucostoma]
MERKRRMPARAAARVEQAAKKSRTETPLPPDHRTATPSSVHNSTPSPEDIQEPARPPPPPLPTSIQPGKPLPTIEDPQPEDLPNKDYQTIQESGVLAESLSRSRQRWISEVLLEKYWTKPIKKRGVVQDDAKNPPKESMAKVGQVTISLEPHYFEATMYAVKDPNKTAQQPTSRPILQYGPPNGVMPPPPTPSSKAATPRSTPAPAPAPTAVPPTLSAPPPPPIPSPAVPTSQPIHPLPPTPGIAPARQPPSVASHGAPMTAPAVPPVIAKAVASPRGMESMLSTDSASPAPPSRPVNQPQPQSQPLAPQILQPSPSPSVPAALQGTGVAAPFSAPGVVPAQPPLPLAGAPTPPGSSRPAPPVPPQNRPPAPVGADPIIVTLAEKANEDPQLRDLMKRVANGNAPKDELARFQAIIDQITAESKRKGALQGPSADRLFVDGRNVRYFAHEVDAIIAIVFRSNPKTTSADLVPPSGSDPLVVALVKSALDDAKTLERIRRIAKDTPEFSDATDLKETLDSLKSQLVQQKPQSPAGPARANGAPTTTPQSVQQPPPAPPAPQQALRSKGPPPVVKPDVSAVVFEFAGGNGDRYLFPKYSIVEHVQTPSGPQVIASFLIVRKGSISEYGGDPKLDYYQPVTVRISATQPRHLEYFSRVVAPPEEVKRYMEDVMDNMTRAEYVLLAWRLPKPDKEVKEDGSGPGSERDNKAEESHTATPEIEDPGLWRKGLTWKKDKTVKQLSAKSASLKDGDKRIASEEEQYQNFIASVSRKQTEVED